METIGNIQIFGYDDICKMQKINETIRKQIGINTLMSCGAREWKSLNWDGKTQGLQFRVNAGSKRQFIKVILNANDLYSVISYKLKRITDEIIILEEFHDVYCEMLSDIVYKMVNK